MSGQEHGVGRGGRNVVELDQRRSDVGDALSLRTRADMQ